MIKATKQRIFNYATLLVEQAMNQSNVPLFHPRDFRSAPVCNFPLIYLFIVQRLYPENFGAKLFQYDMSSIQASAHKVLHRGHTLFFIYKKLVVVCCKMFAFLKAIFTLVYKKLVLGGQKV